QFKKNVFNLPKSLKKLKATAAQLEANFEKFDLIMTPVIAKTPTKIGYFDVTLPYAEISKRAVEFAPYTGLQNISGAPAISLPMGISSDGLPIGVHFSAPFGQDKLLLEFAYELEQAQPWKFVYQF
ncbi:MAG TPA: amidase family protein, partial [Chitinophagales bacterium]